MSFDKEELQKDLEFLQYLDYYTDDEVYKYVFIIIYDYKGKTIHH